MSETCAMATTNTPDHCRFGSVGRALAGVEMRLADDGELLIRGPTVASRYRNRPAETAAAFDPDGWLRTGDIADCDSEGYWRITGRKKELIISAAGKNMSPINIEAALKGAGPIIMQACVIGDRRPYNIALVVVSAAYSKLADAELDREVKSAVDMANAQLSRVEQIKKFAVFRDEWLAGGDELTPTMKLRRREIETKYQSVIDGLYGSF
jgi:long-subunit acyl-CoA synthetase (AMP-forming)